MPWACAQPDHRHPGSADRGVIAIARVAFVSTYPPRPCGIASFTHQLAGTAHDREVVVLPWPAHSVTYPHEVHHRLRTDAPHEVQPTAAELSECVDVASIQYHPDIWGGDEQTDVLEFMDALDIPAVVTLHAIEPEPSDAHRELIRAIAERAAAMVTMSQHARAVLETVYSVDPWRIVTIPHGVADVPILDPQTAKTLLGLAGRDVILTFGLITPRKGIEHMLRALPAVVADHPRTLYAIVGATHPDEIASNGEAYRQSLQTLVRTLGMAANVQFVDNFVGRVELIRWLQSADVVVTPYTDLGQSVAGTLAAAMGTGRAVVSTPYAYATEALADERGVLVTPNAPADLARAVSDLLSDGERRTAIGQRAHDWSRCMTWTKVGDEYAALFERVTAGRSKRVAPVFRAGSRRTGVGARR